MAVHGKLVHEYQDDFQWIRIIDRMPERHRYLYFESSIQGSLDLETPQKPVLEYIEAMLNGAVQWVPYPEKVLVGGLGACAIYHGIRGLSSRPEITVFENEPMILALAQSYFHFPKDENVVLGDVREHLDPQRHGSADLFFLDCYNALSMPPHLMTSEFFTGVKAVLSEGGLCIVNLWDSVCNALCGHQLRTLAEVFGSIGFLRCSLDHNLIVFARKGGWPHTKDEVLVGEALLSVQVIRKDDERQWPDFVAEGDVLVDENLSAVLARFGVC